MSKPTIEIDFAEAIDFGDLPGKVPAWTIDPPEVGTVPDQVVDIGSIAPSLDWWF